LSSRSKTVRALLRRSWVAILAPLLASILLLAGLPAARADTYPAKPITVVVPAAPGGVTDLIARALGERLSTNLGQPVVIENKPGASNQLAAEMVARAAPDGYTLLVSPEATFVINPYLFSKLHYDPAKDFVPVAGLISIHQALIANPALPAQNVGELIALAKRKPGGLNYGTYGVGSTGHLNMEMFQRMAGVNLVAIHYKGATPALTDVIAGNIQLMFISVGSAVQPLQAGEIKVLAVGSRERLPRLPDIPTVAESGVPGFEATSWFGLFAPAATPSPIVERLNALARSALADPQLRAKLLEPQFFEPMAGSPADFAAFIKRDGEKWHDVIRAANVKLD
jgi:tripartite-type tricarboxylate transporter receptor subunit TctC